MHDAIRELTAAEIATWCQSAAAPVLLDVREDWERARAALPGARSAPLSRWTHALAELALPHDAPLVTFCHHGVRSLRAAQALAEAGYTQVTSMAGGIDAWAADVDAGVGRY